MTEVLTIGLGYIGLPTSALIASNKIKVVGVDVNKDIVSTINSGRIHIIEPDLDKVVEKAVDEGYLRATLKACQANVYLIVVPTPFKGDHEPDISYVEAATKSIIKLLKENDLFIIESTSPVGTTEKMKDLIYEQRPDLVNKIGVAYCPERVLPGNVMFELVNNDRVIGGVDEKSTSMAINFYKKFVNGNLHATNARTAEMCKLTENASRDLQIAFANELSIICEKANINVWNLIDLANKHPRVNILDPGCGVGGHCIAVDPYFITSSFKEESKLIGLAREVNNYKSTWVTDDIIRRIKDFTKRYNINPKIALLGVTFKANIDDLRESPALKIANYVNKNYDCNNTFVVEPNIKNFKNLKIIDLHKAKSDCDILFILVNHDEFKGLKPNENIISYTKLN